MAALPEHAKVVVIGQGGIVGASVFITSSKRVGMTLWDSRNQPSRRTLDQHHTRPISAI